MLLGGRGPGVDRIDLGALSGTLLMAMMLGAGAGCNTRLVPGGNIGTGTPGPGFGGSGGGNVGIGDAGGGGSNDNANTGGDGNSGTDANTSGPMDMSTGGTACVADADCDDGLFCTGVERCADGVCTSGVSPCDVDTQTCTELTQVCIDNICASDNDCPPGQVCDQVSGNCLDISAGMCGPGAGTCLIENPTPGCESADCCALVCAFEPNCCISPWSNACAVLGTRFCAGFVDR